MTREDDLRAENKERRSDVRLTLLFLFVAFQLGMQPKIRKRSHLMPSIHHATGFYQGETSMGANPSKSSSELMVEFIKAVARPLFASVVLISFWGPLRSSVSQL
jgi:hypothetical protein